MIMDHNPWSFSEGRFAAASVMFVINYACYFSEIYRGGIQGVPLGQQEAGEVLGMTKGQIFRHVTLLQMIKRIVPPMANEVITLVKDTSLARIISYQEVIWAGYAFMKGSHGLSGLIWAAVLHGRILPCVQRRRLLPAWQAGAQARVLQIRRRAYVRTGSQEP